VDDVADKVSVMTEQDDVPAPRAITSRDVRIARLVIKENLR
jgi:hypothetical protein